MPGQPLLFALLLLSWKLDVVGGHKSSNSIGNISISFFTTSHSESPSTPTSHSGSSSPPTSHSGSSSTPTSHSGSSSPPTSHSGSSSTPTSHSGSSSTPSSHSESPSIPPSHSGSSSTPPSHSGYSSTPISHNRSSSTPLSHNDSSSTPSSHNGSLSTPTSHASWSSSTPFKGSSPNPSASFGAPSAVTSMATPGETQRNPGVVIVVCLFVSILVLGSVIVAVKCFRKNINGFEKMDELPMETV